MPAPVLIPHQVAALSGGSAPIGVPVSLGTATGTTTSLSLATSNEVVPESLIVVLANDDDNSSTSPTSCSDQVGNTYTRLSVTTSNDGETNAFFYSIITTALPSGSTITVTFAGVATKNGIGAVAVTGVASLDVNGTGTKGASTTPSVATGALAANKEIVFAYTTVELSSTLTEAAGFTSISNFSSSAGARTYWAYQIAASPASVTYAPTLGTSRNWSSNIATFKGVRQS